MTVCWEDSFDSCSVNRKSPISLEKKAVKTFVSRCKSVQSTELDIVNGSLCNLCALPLGLQLHIVATHC